MIFLLAYESLSFNDGQFDVLESNIRKIASIQSTYSDVFLILTDKTKNEVISILDKYSAGNKYILASVIEISGNLNPKLAKLIADFSLKG